MFNAEEWERDKQALARLQSWAHAVGDYHSREALSRYHTFMDAAVKSGRVQEEGLAPAANA